MLKKIFEDISPLVISVDDILTDSGKSMSDISDAILVFKNAVTDDDEDAVFNKSIGVGGITNNDPTKTLTVDFEFGDFGTGLLEIDNQYFIGFGVKFTGDSRFREYPIDGDDKIVITQDIIRG